MGNKVYMKQKSDPKEVIHTRNPTFPESLMTEKCPAKFDLKAFLDFHVYGFILFYNYMVTHIVPFLVFSIVPVVRIT